MSNSTSNNKMSVMQLTLLTALNMMGSGIIMLPTKLAEIGTFSILSWLVTATGSTAMAYAFAKCGMLSRRPGGMGGYSEYAFGQSGNFMANYTYAVSLIIANVAIAVTVVGYASALFDVTLSPVGTCIATIATLWICTSLNFRGPKITGSRTSPPGARSCRSRVSRSSAGSGSARRSTSNRGTPTTCPSSARSATRSR